MTLADWSIRNRTTIGVLGGLLVLAGARALATLERQAEPDFTIREALIQTPYPGASPSEVEREVTEVIERAAQGVGRVQRVESRSSRGLSLVRVKLQDSSDPGQSRDELRHRLDDYRDRLPPGAGPPRLDDGFGEVYPIYLAVTGEGYTQGELHAYAGLLHRELRQIPGVKRIVRYGDPSEAVYVGFKRDQMVEYGIAPREVEQALAAVNLPADAGQLRLNGQRIPIDPTAGAFQSEQRLGELLIRGAGPTGTGPLYLRDLAEIRRGDREPAANLLRYDGRAAIGLAIATREGSSALGVSEAIQRRLDALQADRPLGMEPRFITLPSQPVSPARLWWAIGLMTGGLLLFMGLRAGLVVIAGLAVTLMGTFAGMALGGMALQQVSLGGLILALGLSVHNPVWVTHGLRARMARGMDAATATRELLGQSAISLLAASVIALAGFAAIGQSQGGMGEYLRSLLQVILIALPLSWLVAVTVVPLLCARLLKVDSEAEPGRRSGPHGGALAWLYRSLLTSAMRQRWLSIALVAGLCLASGIGFGNLRSGLLVDTTRSRLHVELWFPADTAVEYTTRRAQDAERLLLAHDGIRHVTSEIGGGNPRLLAADRSEYPHPGLARLLIEVEDYRAISTLTSSLQTELAEAFPAAVVNVQLLGDGPAVGDAVELRLYGPDSHTLRSLAAKAEAALLDQPGAGAIRSNWEPMVKVLRPQISGAEAQRAGIDRPTLARALAYAGEGRQLGVYRERGELLPIIARASDLERADLDNLAAIQLWSPASGRPVPADQLVSRFGIGFEDPYLWRRNGQRVLTVFADARPGLASDELLARVKSRIEKAVNVDLAAVLDTRFAGNEDPFEGFTAATLEITPDARWPLKGLAGYSMAWGGEAEDAARANRALADSSLVWLGLMALIVLALSNSIRKTLILWLSVPPAIIGIAPALLVSGQALGFMALLGSIGLSGLLIRTAMVLSDEICQQAEGGGFDIQTIVAAAVSQLAPVLIITADTILTLLPLMNAALFAPMALSVMSGLGVASLIGLILVPVLYATLFGTRSRT